MITKNYVSFKVAKPLKRKGLAKRLMSFTKMNKTVFDVAMWATELALIEDTSLVISVVKLMNRYESINF